MEGNPEKKKKVQRRKTSNKRKALLLGLGLDSQDEHVRITRGPNFHLVGGTRETHEAMQETAIKVGEELNKRGKQLEEIGPQEFLDIMHKVK